MITAYRYYLLRAVRPYLESVVVQSYVDGPQATATCKRPRVGVVVHEHTAPDPDCQCGLYALKPDVLASEHEIIAAPINGMMTSHQFRALLESRPRQSAIARVGLYGRVIEYELGYRAQHLVIQHLTLLTRGRQFTREFCASLSGVYQCDVSQAIVKHGGELCKLRLPAV